MYTISIHNKKSTERNNGTICTLFFGASEDYGTWTRTMKHRGIDHRPLAQRPMVEYELENTKKCARLRWLIYKDWQALIEDEFAATEGQNREWINELLKISKIGKTFEQIAAAVARWQNKPIVKQQQLFDEN